LKLALIAPISYLSWVKQSDIGFVLAHLCFERVYKKFYANLELYKILDNAAYETGKPLSPEALFRIAREIGADEIILPDVLLNKQATIELVTEAISKLPKQHTWQVVPQGQDDLEFIECLLELQDNPDIDIIGLPIWLDRTFLDGRRTVYDALKKHKRKPFRLLGLDRYIEIFYYGKDVLSVDTSLPFSATYNNLPVSAVRSFPHERGRISLTFRGKLNEGLLKEHIRFLKSLCSIHETRSL